MEGPAASSAPAGTSNLACRTASVRWTRCPQVPPKANTSRVLAQEKRCQAYSGVTRESRPEERFVSHINLDVFGPA